MNQNRINYWRKKLVEKQIENSANDITNTIKCPHCLLFVFIEDGCNSVTCTSAFCKGRKLFCKICGNKLLHTQKLSHFSQGQYANSCNSLSNLN